MPCIACGLIVHGGEYAGIKLMLVACSGMYVSVTSATRDKTMYTYSICIYRSRDGLELQYPKAEGCFIYSKQESQIMVCQLVFLWMKNTFQWRAITFVPLPTRGRCHSEENYVYSRVDC